MKTINSLFLALAALFIWSACEDDADKYYLSSLTENELIASTNNIVLTMWHRLMYLAIPCYLVIHQHLNTLS